MKYLCYIILITLSVTYVSCTSKNIVLINKEFTIGETDLVKQEFLNFIDDSVCIYIQIFKCDIDEKYRNVEIKCLYKISGDYVDLTAIEQPDFLVGKSCYAIPDSVLQKCDVIYIDTPENPFYLARYGLWDRAKAYGFINNINGTERLFYKKDNLFHAKVLSCYGDDASANYQAFHNSTKKGLGYKAASKIFYSGKVPLHR